MKAVSAFPVFGMLPTFGVLVRAVLACSCRVGEIRAMLGFGGQCRVEISVLVASVPCLPSHMYICIYIYICKHINICMCICIYIYM